MKKKVLILGAGMSGLGAAWKLSESGLDVELFDSAPCVGGMAASFKYDDSIFDLGTHGLHASKKENDIIIDEVKNLLKTDLISVVRRASIYFKGKRFNYPLTPKEIFFGLDFYTSFYCFFDFLKTRIKLRFNRKNENEDNFEAWMKNRFGNRLYNIYFRPYTQRVWGFDPRFLSPKWAQTRIPVISLWDTIIKSLVGPLAEKEAEQHSHSPYRKYFYYTHQGSGKISDKLAEEIVRNKGKIYLNYEVKKIKLRKNHVTEIITETNGVMGVNQGDYFVSTIPVNEMMKIIDPLLPEDILTVANNLRFRAMHLLYLIIKKERISSDQWIYFSDDDIIFNRFSEFKNCSPYLMPNNKTSLCLEITCFQNDDIWNMSEEEIFTKCVGALEKYNIINKKDIINFFSKRLLYAYPVWDINYKKNLDKIFNCLQNIDNLFSIGRQGRFEYYNMDQCLEDGFKIAKLITKKN